MYTGIPTAFICHNETLVYILFIFNNGGNAVQLTFVISFYIYLYCYSLFFISKITLRPVI